MSLKLFPCEVCAKTFTEKSNLKRHIKIIHTTNDEPELFKCDICGKTFNVRSNLNTHIKTIHSNNRFICEMCGKSFNLRCNLETHIKTIHSKNESFQFSCPVCTKTFNVRSNLNRHVKTIHLTNVSERYTCEVCAKSFNVRSNLEIHIKTIHSSDRFTCEICAKTFQLRSKLDSHIKTIHSRNSERKKKVRCLLCEGVFNITEFKRHFPKVHGIALKTEQLKFETEYNFQTWKKSIEEQETASYVKTCGSACSKIYQKIVYFKCHRSGFYKGKFESDQRQRAIKKQGTSKINSYCPARIKAMTCNDGSIKVIYCSTHVGHKMELAHLNIPLDDRKELASKIIAKMSFESIIDEVQTSGINLQRTHLIKKQDLRNIIRDFSLGHEFMPQRKPKKLGGKQNNQDIQINNILKTTQEDDDIPAEMDNFDLEALKQKVSDECNLILSKVTSTKQINVLLTNLKNLKPVLDSDELSLGGIESFPDATEESTNTKQKVSPQSTKEIPMIIKESFKKHEAASIPPLEESNEFDRNTIHQLL